jgi:hypothetical protein
MLEDGRAEVRPFSSLASDLKLEEISLEHLQQKAVKLDDAKVPEYLWNRHC